MPRLQRFQEDDDPLGVGEPEFPTELGTKKAPIGVPDDYTTQYSPLPREVAPVSRPPRYFDGDEFMPVQFSPDKIADLQRQLVAVGLLRPGIRIGVGDWDEPSIDAFYRLLGYANQNGISWKAALNKLSTEGAGFSEVDEFGNLVPVGQSAGELVPTRTTPPEELRRVFRTAVIDTLGQGWDEGRIESMVSSYQAMEIQRQQEAFSAEGTSQNIVGIPSPESFAIEQAETAEPGRAQAEQGLDYANQFMDLIGRWSR